MVRVWSEGKYLQKVLLTYNRTFERRWRQRRQKKIKLATKHQMRWKRLKYEISIKVEEREPQRHPRRRDRRGKETNNA